MLFLVVPIAALLPPVTAAAQEELDRPLRVYLDCNDCSSEFFVREIPWVDFVRDRQDADIHLLGTRQATGAGGAAYDLEFRGRGALDGQVVTLRAVVAPDATEAARRSELLRVARLGLLPFASLTPAAPGVELTLPDEGGSVGAGRESDPWNRWVFQVGVNGFTNGESRQSSLSTSGNATASRVTADWKLMMSVRGSASRSEFELNDTTTFTSRRESYSSEFSAVKSLGPHWGAGVVGEWSRSTFSNYDGSAVVGGAVEYNIYPYSESSRRLLTILYAIGPRYNDYHEVTIFRETSEVVLEQMLVAAYDVTQPWGSVDAALRGTHYITKIGDGDPWPDPQYDASLFLGFDVRLVKGLSARTHGSVSMVRGQIQLPASGLTDEEILTQQRELATNYRYFISFGLSYRFGSIFSDVVNPRFGRL